MQNSNNRNSKAINSIINEVYRRWGIDSRNNVDSKNRRATIIDDKLITVIGQTTNEKELCLEIEKMEEKYLQP